MQKILVPKTGISRILPKNGKISSTPGTVKYIGKTRENHVKLHLLDYNEADFTEKDLANIKESIPFKESPTVTWLNVTGVHDEALIQEIGEIFKVHPLVLEDIANTTQRPKVEEYEDYFFVVIKTAFFDDKSHEMNLEQISLIVGKDYVISLQEKEDDILGELMERIRNNKGKLRKLGSDYLMYGIMDTVVDHYFLVLEKVGEQIEVMEEALIQKADQKVLAKIYTLKQELLFLRKSIWPMREIVNILQRMENNLLQPETAVYMRDLYDHTVQVMETVETFRDMTSGMLDLYLSTISNKMNEVMKILTIFSAIFIPLTFLSGVYGMNFDFMPELKWRFGYFLWWGLVTILALGMMLFFKRKKWF